MNTIDRVMELLNERKIEQKQLADYIGLSAQAFSQWKAGRNQSYLKYVDKIAEFLGVSTDYLLGKDEIKNRPMSPDDMISIHTPLAGSDTGLLRPTQTAL